MVISAAGLGFSPCYEMECRARVLQKLLQMLQYLKGEIRYGNTSLPDAFLGISRKMPEEYGAFLKEAAMEMENASGVRFGEIFEKCAKEKLPLSVLKADEREAFCSLGESLGYLDLTMQLKMLDQYEDELKGSLEALRREMPEKKKVYRSLGMLGGMLLAILVW